MIGKSGERGSGISILAARHDDDDIVSYVSHRPVLTNDQLTGWLVLPYVDTYGGYFILKPVMSSLIDYSTKK